MKTSRRIRQRLEAELRRVEHRLRRLQTESAPATSSAPPEERAHIGDFHDHAMAAEAADMAYETQRRLLLRQAALQDALRRVLEGTYGWCGDCGRLIPESRLRAIPQAALCVQCQEQRERDVGVR